MKYKITAFYIAAMAMIITACSKMDDYKDEFLAGGSITYPGKMDSVKVLSGRNRVKITGLFTSDPKIVKYTVFWNSKQDSIVVPVKRTSGVDSVSVFINNLPEGIMSFEIRTYDAKGNISIPVTIAGNVYGDRYQSSLINRAVKKAELQTDMSALINWADVNSDAGVMAMQIKYTDTSAIEHDTIIRSASQNLVTSLPALNRSATFFNYRTAYLPNATAIDTFYVDYQKQAVTADITDLYFKNYSQAFASTTTSGRFRDPADWTVTDPVKNHGGYGGWGSDDGTVLVMESGWGSPAIVDGKMFQTFTLPAGKYMFSVNLGNNGFTGPVYITAAVGTTLPDGAQVPANSLGYASLKDKQFEFTLTEPTQVSIGFVANMGTGGEYWRVKSVKLFSK